MPYNSKQELDYLRLKRELKAGKIRPVYLFYGSEDYLIEQALEQISAHILPAHDSSGFTAVDGQSVPLSDVLSMADTVSLFGDSRLLVVKNAPYFTKGSKAEAGEMQRLLTVSSDACIVFCAAEMYAALKVCKELSAAGAVYRFDTLKTAGLRTWMLDYVTAHGKKITPAAADLFLERVGSELRNLAMELDKLMTYTGARKEIEEESVQAVTVRAVQADIFALIDAAVYGHTAKALILLKDLLSAGEPPLRILTMIIRQFRLIGEAKDLLAAHETNLAGALKIHPYAAEKLAQQAQRTEDVRVRRAIELLVQCELDIKRGRIQPVLALETLVVALGAPVKNKLDA